MPGWYWYLLVAATLRALTQPVHKMVSLLSCCLHPQSEGSAIRNTTTTDHRPMVRPHSPTTGPFASPDVDLSTEDESEADETCAPVTAEQQRSITTSLQLGRLSYAKSGPSIFDMSRAPSAQFSTRVSSPSGGQQSTRVSSTNSIQLPADLLPYDSLAAAATLSRNISLRHTPSVLSPAVQVVLEQVHALHIDNGNVEGLAGAPRSSQRTNTHAMMDCMLCSAHLCSQLHASVLSQQLHR